MQFNQIDYFYNDQCYNIFITTMIKQGQIIEESPKTNRKEQRKTTRTPQQQSQFANTLFNDISSANPILPPGVHRDYHEIHSLRYKQLLQKSKLNKTTFPEVRTRNWLNQTQGYISINKFNNNNVAFLQEAEEEVSEFKQLIQGKVPVYFRINNKKFNKIDREQISYFSSIFVNYKKQEIKSRKNPIFQYLPRIYKEMKPPQKIEDVLNFNSSFQSGNLFCAVKCPEQHLPTYEVYMQNDINTKGCTQWFYFSIWTERRIKFKIKIMNFYKPTSLYMIGMKILMSTDQNQWKRVGTAIKYYRIALKDGRESYCLEFIYQIEQSHKQHFFSSGFPYTYSHLQNILGMISQSPLYPRITIKSILCQTFLGNNIYTLTISNHIKTKVQKPMIYIIGRQHPGETPSSFIVEGLIRTLLSNRLQMEEIRQNFIVKVIPMINIDGVVNGNYRSNFSGNDVNRQWQEPSRRYHPEIYMLKQQILSNKKNVYFFLDIHAHSRKMNSFFYGSKGISMDNRLYPFVCSKLNKNISFSQCSFVDDPSKKTTARVVLENEANIKKSLTFQASFYGYQDEVKKTRTHFKEQDLKGLGESLALGLYYSQIGTARYLSKSQSEQEKAKKQEIDSGRNSVSCHLGQEAKKQKKSEVYAKIQKNCARIVQKWKKQLQKQVKQDQALSEGSSLDPQHFQLTQVQQQKITHVNQQTLTKWNQSNPQDKHQQKIDKNDQMAIEEQKIQNQEEQNIYKLVSIQKSNQQHKDNQEAMKYSFFPIQSNLRNSLVVKKLQSQLQMQRTHRRYESFRTQKERQQEQIAKSSRLKNEVIEGKRFKSIDIEPKQPHNYRNNIIEMKKALKYFIENKSYDYKSTDYDDYKAYMKNSSNGTTLVFSDKESIARIKKKYARI